MDQLKRTKESFYCKVKKIAVRTTEQQSKYWINKDLMLHPFLRIFTLTSSVMEFTDENIIFYLNNQGIKKTAKASSEVVQLRPPELLSTALYGLHAALCFSLFLTPTQAFAYTFTNLFLHVAK